jgi:hypothetical protein
MTQSPILLSLPDAAAYIGFSRTRLYSVLHLLDVRKAGRRTLVTRASLDHFMGSLPKKYIKPPKVPR